MATMRRNRLRPFALWTGTMVSLLITTAFVAKFRRGHCHRCGYDLTGLTEPRCPECGQPFEPKGDAP